MPIQKIQAGRIITVDVQSYVGNKGTIFYDEDIAQLRLSDGVTPGGILFDSYILPIASSSTVGGVKIGQNLSISPDGTISAVGSISDSFKTIKVDGQDDLVADGTDYLQFSSGNGIIITTDANTGPYKKITVSAITNLDGGYVDSVYEPDNLVADGGIP